MSLVLYCETNKGLSRTWSSSIYNYHCWFQKQVQFLHISPDIVSNQWFYFSEFAKTVLTSLLLSNLQCIHLLTKICYLTSFYLICSADQKTFPLVDSWLIQSTVRGSLQNQNSNSVDLYCRKTGFSNQTRWYRDGNWNMLYIQVVVCVSFTSSVWTQIDSNLKIAKLLKSLFTSKARRLNPSSFPNKITGSSYLFFGQTSSAGQEMFLKWSDLGKKCHS